jgi:hypothetical protein
MMNLEGIRRKSYDVLKGAIPKICLQELKKITKNMSLQPVCSPGEKPGFLKYKSGVLSTTERFCKITVASINV